MRNMIVPIALATIVLPTLASAENIEHKVVLPKGSVNAQLHVNANLSKDLSFDPVSIAPDLWFGVGERLTLGLIHSSVATSGFYGLPGPSLCVAGDVCEDVFNNTGVNARVELASGDTALAIDAALLAADVDPFTLGTKLGVVGQWKSNAFALLFNPNLYVGFNRRDEGNKERLNVPLSLMYGVHSKVDIGTQLGLSIPFTDAGDFWQLPISLGAHFLLHENISGLLMFSLPAVAGGDALPLDGFDYRTLTAGVEFTN